MNVHSEREGDVSQNKDEQIRRAAIRVFSREGFHRARMEQVAREAGVAVGTIYNYFPNKQNLLLAVFKTGFDEQLRSFEKLKASGLPIRELLRRLFEQHFLFLKERPDLAQVLLQERFHPEEGFKDRLITLYQEMIKRIETIIREGIDRKWLRRCNPRIIAHALFAVVESISICAMVHDEAQARDLLKHAPAELADFIWMGLQKGETT